MAWRICEAKGIRTFTCLAEGPLSISEIAKRIKITTTESLYYFLKDMERDGLVKIQDDNDYTHCCYKRKYKKIVCRLTKKGKKVSQLTSEVYPTIKKLDEEIESIKKKVDNLLCPK